MIFKPRQGGDDRWAQKRRRDALPQLTEEAQLTLWREHGVAHAQSQQTQARLRRGEHSDAFGQALREGEPLLSIVARCADGSLPSCLREEAI